MSSKGSTCLSVNYQDKGRHLVEHLYNTTNSEGTEIDSGRTYRILTFVNSVEEHITFEQFGPQLCAFKNGHNNNDTQ